MHYELTIEDEDRGREYDLTVNARVVEEIGGAPGHCCDVDGVSVNSVVVYFEKCGHEVQINPEFRRSLERYVERTFDAEIREECIEQFETRTERMAG